jgi:hypothetical protein
VDFYSTEFHLGFLFTASLSMMAGRAREAGRTTIPYGRRKSCDGSSYMPIS